MSQSSPTEVAGAPPRRRRWRLIVSCVILFLCGVLVGAGVSTVVTIRLVRNHFQERIHHPERFVERGTRRLTRRLDLSHEQTGRVRDILMRHHESFLAMRREFHPRVEAQLDELKRDIESVLTPEQADEWEAMLQHWHDLWLAPRHPPPPPPPPPPRHRPREP